jgi:hypothetical protein
MVPAGTGLVPVQTPHALDRAVWWPLIEREGWNHSVAFHLIDRLERALFQPLDEDTENDD